MGRKQRIGVRTRLAALAACVAVGAASCASAVAWGDRVSVVGSFYPLAWAARQVGGDRVSVVDLTPPGGEAHDSQMTAAQRGELQSASLVLILGQIGFQPDVERAATEVPGRVVNAVDGISLHRTASGADPHVWLDPSLMARIVRTVARGLEAVDPAGAAAYRRRAAATAAQLEALADSAGSSFSSCGYDTFVMTHDAFGYLASAEGLRQIPVEGFAPETEPTSVALASAIDAISSGSAGPAVFSEATDEGMRIGDAVAGDAGVPTVPLGTLEAQPPAGDFLSVMRANIRRLAEVLRCG